MGRRLYLALASIFVAQAAGIHMPWGQQLLMMGTLILTSKGVAGVPRATLVVLLATASLGGTFNLPTEPIFVILGDRRADGYGADDGERGGELPGERGDCKDGKGSLGRSGRARRCWKGAALESL